MVTFFIVTGLLVVLALAFVVPVLLKNNQLEADQFDEQNIQIARDRLNELKQDLANGNISQQNFAQTKQELEANLALDLSLAEPSKETTGASARGLAYSLIVAIPVVAAIIYSQVGTFTAVTGEIPQAAEDSPQAPKMSMEEAIAGLKARLEQEPDNAEGWFMLARTYGAMQQYSDAVQAYEKTIELVGDNAGLLLRYADMLIMSQGGGMPDRAAESILKAVELEPDNLQGLWMAGMVATHRADYKQALKYWYRLEPQLQNEVESLTQLRSQIARVEQNLSADTVAAIKQDLAQPMVQTDAGAAITVKVSLDDALKDRLVDTDVLFVYAKAMQGPPMPLAAVKHPASALPLTVTLNDSMAMMPTMKLSNYKQVIIMAVVSRSGQPGVNVGDLYVEQGNVVVSSEQVVSLVINQIKN